ncbi:MAG: D-glycero-beta-D-manno-heptose 1,7-bisphosphate 7-phosphatase [Gammaproteobacteria bacterium]|nr:D-glycero-beta-D-manno-heptose 1,7-bisphosphate 7-phosphatase [Gammaproteobacteria bacterium]
MKLVVLDRDGVINVDSRDYVKSEQEWQALPGSLDAIGRLYRSGYRIVVVTNQAGIAHGKLNAEILAAIHQKMLAHLSQYGGVIEAIFFCPHAPEDHCNCRKPKPGLLRELSRRLRVRLHGVPCIGDKLSDIEAALAVGASPILVRTGHGQAIVDAGEVPHGVPVYANLRAAVDAILSQGSAASR